jgi:hypothetical protein
VPKALDPDFVLHVGRTDTRQADQTATPAEQPPLDPSAKQGGPETTPAPGASAVAARAQDATLDQDRTQAVARTGAPSARRTSRHAPRRTARPPAAPRKSISAKAAARFRDTAIPPGTAGSTVQRSYVLDESHDDLLRNAAAVTGLTINQVAQHALADHLADLDGDDLLTATEPPLTPGTEPPAPRRRTLMILADHDRLLRILRLRFSIQSSDVVRQALDALRQPR